MSVSEMIQQRLDEERGSLPSTNTEDEEGWIQSFSDTHSSYIAWSDAGDVTGRSYEQCQFKHILA